MIANSILKRIKKNRFRGYSRIIKLLAKISNKFRFVSIYNNRYEVKLDLSLNSDIGMFMYESIPHEKGLGLIFEGIVEKGDVVYDVGANQGFYSFKLSPLVKTVYSFEPNPLLFERLKRSVTNITTDQNIQVFNFGLGSENGALNFDPKGSDHTLGNFRNKKSKSHIMVPVRTLDSIVKEGYEKPNVLKIDVEGFEMHVLMGGKSLITTACPIIFMEWSDSFSAEVGFSINDLFEFFGNKDWEVYTIDNEGFLRARDLDKPISTNDLLIVNRGNVKYNLIKKFIAIS